MSEQSMCAKKVSTASNVWHSSDHVSTRLSVVIDHLNNICAMLDKRLLEEEPKMPSSGQVAHERMGLLSDLEHMQKMQHAQLDTIEHKLNMLMNSLD